MALGNSSVALGNSYVALQERCSGKEAALVQDCQWSQMERWSRMECLGVQMKRQWSQMQPPGRPNGTGGAKWSAGASKWEIVGPNRAAAEPNGALIGSSWSAGGAKCSGAKWSARGPNEALAEPK